MTSEELVTGLATAEGARRVPVETPLTAGLLLAGIEITATRPADERTLRRLWRDRRGGGATPLLLLADDPARPGCLTALGTVDAVGPLRSVEAGALASALHRLAGRPRLEAVRELAAELDRLDQAGIPGLKVRDLLTLHTLDVRLRNDAARWGRAQEVTKSLPRGADWRTVLTGLGYQLERRRHRGFLARYQGRPIAVVHPVRDANEFARLDPDGRPPEGVLLNDCEADGAAFGVLAAGGRLRLFRSDPQIGSASSQYLDVDAGSLQDDDLAFLALLGPDFLADGEFDRLQTEARSFGGALRRRLDDTIRQTVLPTLGRSLGRWSSARGADLGSEANREELERAALSLVFRALFIAYAESAGYLPMDNRSYRQNSLTSLVEEAVDSRGRLGAQSTSLWDRFALLVKALRGGNPAWGVPAYNGALFAADGFDGAETLERTSLPDPDFADVLIGIGRDHETTAGVDYSTLEIGHLGHIYEGLLSLRLSVTDVALVYDAAADRYAPATGDQLPDLETGDLLWQTHEGGRKGGGVYYTRTELVRHLVRGAVVPVFNAHLDAVQELATTAPAAAAAKLFDFAVLDPACGSAHFLVEVVNELADRVVKFLGDTPLPDVRATLERLRAGASPGAVIDDVALLRRLVLKRCVFGVDVSPMGAEVAKLSLWLASFVPGLSLAYLGRNVIVGNSLVGVARPEALRAGHPDRPAFWDGALVQALDVAARAAARAAEGDDRTPDEVHASKEADAEAHEAVAGLQQLFDLWTAEPFGVVGARNQVELHGPSIIDGAANKLITVAEQQRERHRFLHWPLAFPGVFSRERPGFDAVVGNPPWKKVKVEQLSYLAMFHPGIEGLRDAEREAAVSQLAEERPDIFDRMEADRAAASRERSYFSGSGEYEAMGGGDSDLYMFFCQRYRAVVREGGRIGVVLPRTAFVNDGSASFRKWLFEDICALRLDFLANTRRWAFDMEARYTIALVVAQRIPHPQSHTTLIAGTAESLESWQRQTESPALSLTTAAFGPGWTVPLLASQADVDLLIRVRRGSPFPFGPARRWKCFSTLDLHESRDKALWRGSDTGSPLWKGESFEQYDPHGGEERACPDSQAVRDRRAKPNPGRESLIAATSPREARRRAQAEEISRCRVAFSGVARSRDGRTVSACLVPAEVCLAHSAPYLTFVGGSDADRAACLGIMNSLAFDWQARRFIEVNVSFFILEGLIVPDLDPGDFDAIAESAARLSSPDDRFVDFATSFGVEAGSLTDEERQRLRVDIDARVARAWDLTEQDLEVLLRDFSLGAVPTDYRQQLRARLAELS